MLSLVPGLFLAGHETTAHVLANTLWQLLIVPDRWSALVADQTLASKFVEETLRRDSSVFGMWRIATVDLELSGSRINAGEKLFVVFLSANRDETHYLEGETFQINRPRAVPHLAFDRGTHHSIGASLARMESRVALETLATRLPGLRIINGFTPSYLPHPFMRGMAELSVKW